MSPTVSWDLISCEITWRRSAKILASDTAACYAHAIVTAPCMGKDIDCVAVGDVCQIAVSLDVGGV